jgi:hypothetical protein
MRPPPVFEPEPRIQPMLRGIRVLRHRYFEAPQAQIRRSDLDEQAFNRLDSGSKITKAPQHQVAARKGLKRTLVHAPIIATGRGVSATLGMHSVIVCPGTLA